MMAVVRHFIIISNDYLRRSRIALDIVEEDDDYTNHIGKIISEIMEKCDGEAPFSTHSILAFDREWALVEKSDPFKSPPACRILSSENGWEKIHSINRTLKKYGNLSACDLVDIVHRANSYKRGENLTKI